MEKIEFVRLSESSYNVLRYGAAGGLVQNIASYSGDRKVANADRARDFVPVRAGRRLKDAERFLEAKEFETNSKNNSGKFHTNVT